MADQDLGQQNSVLAFLSSESLAQLCELIVARLEGTNPWVLASQARRRGFESLHPLRKYKIIGRAANKMSGSRLLAFGLGGFAAISCFPRLLLA